MGSDARAQDGLGGSMPDQATSWRELINENMKEHGLTWADIIATTLTEKELDFMFDNGYGGSNGYHFTAWTKDRVFFPVQYDGAEWVGSAPRNPCDEKTEHVGGG